MNKCLVIFVEGETEEEFYKLLVQNARNLTETKTNCIDVEIVNVKGIGGFKSIALRKFKNRVKPKFGKDCQFIVALCRDTDVFEFEAKPSIDWKKLESEFKANGANKVIHVEAKLSIEDWFLIDLEGVLNFLKLPQNTKCRGKNGVDKLSKLFQKVNKVYVKGNRCNLLIKSINIEKIATSVSDQLLPLYKVLGVKQSR